MLELPLSNDKAKALFRRYRARMALGKKGDAEQDLRAARRIEPQNEADRTQLQQFRSFVEAPTPGPSPSASPSTKPYRRRVPVAEGPDSSTLSTATPYTKTSKLSQYQSLLNALSSRPIKTSESADSATARTISVTHDSSTKPRDPKTEMREMNGHKFGGGIFWYKGQGDPPPSSPSNSDVPQTPKSRSSSSATNPSESTRVIETSSKPLALSSSRTGPLKVPAMLYDFIRL